LKHRAGLLENFTWNIDIEAEAIRLTIETAAIVKPTS
jgi:hypothetical protein